MALSTYSRSGVTGVADGVDGATLFEIIRSAGTETLRMNSELLTGFRMRDFRCFLQINTNNHLIIFHMGLEFFVRHS